MKKSRNKKHSKYAILFIIVGLFLPLFIVFIQQYQSYNREAHAQTTGAVDIVDFDFSPATVTVAVGGTVTWTNATQADPTEHTTTSNITGTANSWDSGITTPGTTFSKTFTAAGTYDYHCNIHTFMMGTVDVVAAAAAPTATTAPVVSAAPTAVPVPTTVTPTPVCLGACPTAVPTTAPGTTTEATDTPEPTTTTTGSSNSLLNFLLDFISILLSLLKALFGGGSSS